MSGDTDLASVVGLIERSPDFDAIREEVRSFAGRRGYDRFVLYTSAPAPGEVVDRVLWVEGDWFGEGTTVDAALYLARCPVNRHVLESDRPFFWTKTGPGGAENYRIVAQPRGAGVHGFQAPVFGRQGLRGAMSFGGTAIDAGLDARLSLEALATAMLNAAERLGVSQPVAARDLSLSARELEVMRWIASGRRHSDIALRLDLSERTIENHLRRIRRRLGVTNTAQAVHRLVQSGQLKA